MRFFMRSGSCVSPIRKLKHSKADEGTWRIFREKIAAYEAAGRTIVYIDESGFARDAPRTRGYHPHWPRRCYRTHDWHAKGRSNAIGALIGKLLVTLLACLKPTSTPMGFMGWTMQDLLPKWPLASIIAMDKATFPKRNDIQKYFSYAGHIIEYLPPYPPVLNPIEHQWAQAKPSVNNKTSQSIFSSNHMLFESFLFGSAISENS
jgi:hypothetical protein